MPNNIWNGWAVLIKFGERQHLNELRHEGLLHLNTTKFFSDLEAKSDIVRADRFEGTDRIFQPAAIKNLTIANEAQGINIVIPPDHLAGPLLISLGKNFPCNIYCMFAVTKPGSSPFVDESNFDFGDSFTIVLNTKEFVNRVCNAAKAAGLACDYGLVEYFDPDVHSGETGPFRKSSHFSFQNEFRFVFRPASDKAIKLRLGNLESITSPVLPLRDINKLVDFGFESAKAAGLLPVGET